MKVFTIIEPTAPKVPILISVPHCGVEFPEELKDLFVDSKRKQPDDTDWFIHQLYDFASEMGITLIHANLSRWVIDLNRNPESKALYDDGRIITGLTTDTDFFGEAIYKEEKSVPDAKEISRRKELYYNPYHDKIAELLQDIKTEFGEALLFDAHSIRKEVKTINSEPFPDLILGTNDGKTASEAIVNVAKEFLDNKAYSFSYNHPFKGGQITRSFGDPANKINAIQLEMAKVNYMNDDELVYDEKRAGKMREVLVPLFENLIKTLKK